MGSILLWELNLLLFPLRKTVSEFYVRDLFHLKTLQKVTQNVIVDDGVIHMIDNNTKVSSPGMKYRHYSPKADVYNYLTASLENYNKFICEKLT